MPGPVADQRITDLVPDMLPERMRDSEETYKLFLEEYYTWLEYIKIDFKEDISDIFAEGAILIGETTFARAVVKSIPTPYCAYVEYISTEKFGIGEEVATEQLSWDDEIEEHKNRFDVDFWALSPGTDYSARVESFTYNAATAASYMMNLQDIDTTDMDIFTKTIRDSHMQGWPELASKSFESAEGDPGTINERQLAKMIKSYGLQKGTDKSMEFLFRLIFGEEADIYYPKDFMLRASDGRWTEPNVTFVRGIRPNGFVLEDFVGKRIRGKTSGVEAIVVNSYQNSVPGKDVSVLVLETPKDAAPGEQGGGPWTPGIHTANNLFVGETIEVLPATFIEEEDWLDQPDNVLTATIFGGLREVDICSAGSGYAPGDTVTFTDRGGVTATANVRLVSNNYAVDYIRVDSQGTGYQIGDELIFYPAYSGGKNGKGIVDTLVDTYSITHSNTAINEYKEYNLVGNGVFGSISNDMNANNNLYYSIHMGLHLDMNTDTTGNTLLVYNTSHFAIGDTVEYLNEITTTYDTAKITGILGDSNEILELRLDSQPNAVDEHHPLYSTTEIRSMTYTHANGDSFSSNGITHHTANVTVAAMQIGDSMYFETEIFGGVGSILVESTGIEYYDIPAVTVVGRSNVATDVTACYAEHLASDARYSTIVGASTSAYNVVTMAVDENAIVFANGHTEADADFPKSRIEVMELFRTEQDGIGETYKRYVWGDNGGGEVRAELVGVLEQESVSYFVLEEQPEQVEAGDSYNMLSEEDPDLEDQIMAEGDSVYIKVLFDSEVSSPFYQGQTFQITDAANNSIGSFDASQVYDFRKQGTDATLTVPYLATNSIFDLAVIDPGSDFSITDRPIGDEQNIEIRDEKQDYLGYHNLNAILIPILGGTIKYAGRWLNDKGQLDSSMVLQDSFFYQDFSYVLRSKLEIQGYRDIVKKLVHMAGHQLWGEVMIITRANAKLYSGGDYGGKYDPNHISHDSYVPTEALGGPTHARPFFEIIRYFGYLGELNEDGTGKPDITFSPFSDGTGYDHPKELIKGEVGSFDVLLHHEPILHDGMFYANGQPIVYITTPGKQYNNQEVFNLVDTMIADDKVGNYPEQVMMEHGGQIYYEFNNEVLNNQPSHGEYVNWHEFHQTRQEGKIVWIDDSLQAQRWGLNIDDSWEGAWYRVDPEGNHLLTQDGFSLIGEDSNQDVFFPSTPFNSGTGLLVVNEANSVDITFTDGNFPTDIEAGQDVNIQLEYFVPRYEDSGLTVDIKKDFVFHEVEAHLNYEEFVVDVFDPTILTSSRLYKSSAMSNPLSDLNDRAEFASGIHFSQSGLKAVWESPIGSEHYIQDDAGNVGLYKNNGSDFASSPFTVMLEYVSGHRWGTTPSNYNIRSAYYIQEERVQILSGGVYNTSLTDQFITITEIGNDYNVQNVSNLPSTYKMEAVDVSNGIYKPVHVSGSLIDWGGSSDEYLGGPGHTPFTSTIRSAIAQELTTRDKVTGNAIVDLAGKDVTIMGVTSPQTTQVDTLLETDPGGITNLDTFPGHNYGTFVVDGVQYNADVRYRGMGWGGWGTVAAGLQPGDLFYCKYVSHPAQGTSMVLHIDTSNQIIYMIQMPSQTSWSDANTPPKYIYKRENVPVTHIDGASTRDLPTVLKYITHLGAGRYTIAHVSGPVISFGVGDNFSAGYYTDFEVQTSQQLDVRDQDGVQSTFTAQDITITEAIPLLKTPLLPTTSMVVSANSSGHHHYFADVDPTGLSFGDTVWLTGKKATGEDLKIPMKITGTSSLTLTTDSWTNDFQFPGTFTLSDVEVEKYSVTNSSGEFPSTYTFTPSGVTGIYDVEHVSGAVLDWGGLNDLYEQGFNTPLVVVNATAATSIPDWKKEVLNLTGSVIDSNSVAPIVNFDINIPTGIYYFTDMVATRPSLIQTFSGGFGQPLFFEQEISSRDATYIRYNFEVPNYFLDGTIQLYPLKEVEFHLEPAHLWQSDPLDWENNYSRSIDLAPNGNRSHFPQAPGTNYLNGGINEDGHWEAFAHGRNQQNRGAFSWVHIGYMPDVVKGTLTARFDPPKTQIVHGHEAIEITEVILPYLHVGLGSEIEFPPAIIDVAMMSQDDIEPYWWHRQVEHHLSANLEMLVVSDLGDRRQEYEIVVDTGWTADVLDYEVEIGSLREWESNFIAVPFGSGVGRIEEEGGIFDFLLEDGSTWFQTEGAGENYLLEPIEIEMELYAVQQVNVSILSFEVDTYLSGSQLPFSVHREYVEIEFKHYPAINVQFGYVEGDHIPFSGDMGAGDIVTEDGLYKLTYEGQPRVVLPEPVEKEHEIFIRYNSFTPPTPDNLSGEEGVVGLQYEDGGYIWQEGEYDPHNPFGFGSNPWRVFTEPGDNPYRDIDLELEAIMTPVIIPDEHSIEFKWREADVIPMGDVIVYNHNKYAYQFHRHLEIYLYADVVSPIIPADQMIHTIESKCWILPPEMYVDWSPEHVKYPCMLFEDGYWIVDENWHDEKSPLEKGHICFEPGTWGEDWDSEFHEVEFELIAKTQPVLPPPELPPLLWVQYYGPPNVIFDNEIEIETTVYGIGAWKILDVPGDFQWEGKFGEVIEMGDMVATSSDGARHVEYEIVIETQAVFARDVAGAHYMEIDLSSSWSVISEPQPSEFSSFILNQPISGLTENSNEISPIAGKIVFGWDVEIADPVTFHECYADIDLTIQAVYDPQDVESEHTFSSGVHIIRMLSDAELAAQMLHPTIIPNILTQLTHLNPFPEAIYVGNDSDEFLQVEGSDLQMVASPAMAPIVKPENDFAEMEYELPVNFISDNLETLADCAWGQTTWDTYLEWDGARDRMEIDSNYQQSSSQWWKHEGPESDSIQERSKEIRIAMGNSRGSQSRLYNHLAIAELWANPEYHANPANGGTWQTASWSQQTGAYEHKWGGEWTVSTLMSNHTGAKWDGYGFLWSTGYENHTNRETSGVMLYEEDGLVHFQLGGGSNHRDYTSMFIHGFLDVPLNPSQNTYITNTNPASNLYNESEGQFCEVHTMGNPYGFSGQPADQEAWYQITVVYNGGPVGYLNTHLNGLTEDEMCENIKGSFKFYQTNMASGEIVEMEFKNFTTSTNDNTFGYLQGDTHIHQAHPSSHYSEFGIGCGNGGDNAWCIKGKWGGTQWIEEALSKEELQGDELRRGGFCLDPIGFKRNRALSSSTCDQTNAAFYSPSYNDNKLLPTTDYSHEYNLFADNNPTTTSAMRYRQGSGDWENRVIQPDCNDWLKAFKDDRAASSSSIWIASILTPERPVDTNIEELVANVVSDVDFRGDLEIQSIVNAWVEGGESYGTTFESIMTEGNENLVTEGDEDLDGHMGIYAVDNSRLNSEYEWEISYTANLAVINAETHMGAFGLPLAWEVKEFIDSYTFIPSISAEFNWEGGSWEPPIEVSNTISIFGGHQNTVSQTYDTLASIKEPQSGLGTQAVVAESLGTKEVNHEIKMDAYNIGQTEINYNALTSEADVDIFTEGDIEIDFPSTTIIGGNLIVTDIHYERLSLGVDMNDILLGPVDLAPTVTPLFDQDPSIELQILPPLQTGSLLEGMYEVTATNSVTINESLDTPPLDNYTRVASQSPSGSGEVLKRTISNAFVGMGINSLGKLLIVTQDGDYMITQNSSTMLAMQDHSEELYQVIADDDGNILTVDIGDDPDAESITQENSYRIIMNAPYVPVATEIILDSIASPRTTDDIAFAPYVNYRYQ